MENEIAIKASKDDQRISMHEKLQVPKENITLTHSTRPYPLLPTEWYKKIGMENEIVIKASKNDQCIASTELVQVLKENVSISLQYPLLPIAWYKKVGQDMENRKSGNKSKNNAPKSSKDLSHTTKFPFPLLNKSWYQRRGKLAAKISHEKKRNTKRKGFLHHNTKISVEYENFNGTLAEAKSNLMLLIQTAEDMKKKATFMATLKAAQLAVPREERQRILGKSGEKRPRTTSALIFSQLSRFLNIKQVYVCGKAFIIENKNALQEKGSETSTAIR